MVVRTLIECWQRSFHPVLRKFTRLSKKITQVTSFQLEYLASKLVIDPAPSNFYQGSLQSLSRFFQTPKGQDIMDVDHDRFYGQLMPILRSISNACFIAIDVEMSGIPIRSNSSADRSHNLGKLSLQQQYEETKDAAERYQVLQIGITCVEEDQERGVYVARPYNFNVTPLFTQGDRLDINRNITFSSSAIQFLMKNSFDMGAVFSKGIPYLSREEEELARQKYAKRQDTPSSIPDIVIPESDLEAQKFYEKSRKTVSEWVNQKKGDIDFVNIGCPGGLNGFQRRLVHQLIRSEFPAYRTFSRSNGDFMQIEKLDLDNEARIAKSRLQSFESVIAKQTGEQSPFETSAIRILLIDILGIRFIFEALAGGDLASIEPKWLCVNENGQPAFSDTEAIKLELQELKENLKAKSHILIGHNLFTDLIFIYKTFIGPLPNEVTEFSSLIHALFPKVIDTKYLATHEGSSMRTKSSLKDLCDDLKNRDTPSIMLAEKHISYSIKGKEHEAGYDSWMTAQVFVKLSSKLAVESPSVTQQVTTPNSEFEIIKLNDPIDFRGATPKLPETNNILRGTDLKHINLGGQSGALNITKKPECWSPELKHFFNNVSTGNIFGKLDTDGTENHGLFLSSSLEKSNGRLPLEHAVSAREPTLMDSDVDDGFRVVSKRKPHLRTQLPSKSTSTSSYLYEVDLLEGESRNWRAPQLNRYSALDPDQSKQGKWIPPINGSFWKVYNNRLRVYGTVTGICYLGD